VLPRPSFFKGDLLVRGGGGRGREKREKRRKWGKKGGRGEDDPLTQIPGSAPGYFVFNTATVSRLYEVILLDRRNAAVPVFLFYFFKYTVT